jgi:hypothetical protein
MHKPAIIVLIGLMTIFLSNNLSAQAVLFDFDSAPIHTSLPLTLTIGGITAHFSATGQEFSIQDYFGNNFVPIGFSGLFICPNSINASDLLIRFDQTLTDFSILYAPEEYGCDSSATMRVTAYMNGSYVGTNTKIASNPGTWPVDTLSCSFPQGFDSVVVHYDHARPSGCSDWGPIFAADNTRVTPFSVSVKSEGELPVMFILLQNYPNPFNPSTTIKYQLPTQSYVTLKVFDVLGREVATLVNSVEQPGYKTVNFSAKGGSASGGNTNNLASGVYYYRIEASEYCETKKLLLMK